jgi:small nuclear ribonucleoprotein (snRNP)-like protein
VSLPLSYKGRKRKRKLERTWRIHNSNSTRVKQRNGIADKTLTNTVTGTLKGYDQLMNLVLDDVKEITRGMSYPPTLHLSTLTSHSPPFHAHLSLSFPLTSSPHPRLPHRTSRLTQATDDEGNTSSRPLGLLVARGTLLVLISPLDGSEEIANPFVQATEDEGAAAAI